LPAFSFHFGIQPWDIERLCMAEVRKYQRTLEEISKAKG
jgi:hypothetical protein